MSGHSKWAQIKHKKAKADAKRGQVFTKLIRELTIAAREGGGDPESNARLRHAIELARENNMPYENIERAIKRGTGELPGQTFEEITYEGYGPGSVAVIVETATDNKNRTTAEIRHIFTKYGGKLGTTGCVSYMFSPKGIIYVDKSVGEEKIFELVVDAGVDDIKTEDDSIMITTDVKNFESVKDILTKNNVKIIESKITKIPQNYVHLEGEKAQSLLKFLDELEAHDDVQEVYANFDIPDSLLMEASKD